MKLGLIASLALVSATLLLSGCAVTHQQPVQLSATAISPTPSTSVGVVMTKLPKVDTDFPGANCLLCYGLAAAANKSLTDYTHQLGYEDLPKLKDDLAELIRKKGGTVQVIADELDLRSLPDAANKGPNLAMKDFASLRAKYHVDKLLVVNIYTLGFLRTYASYIPTSDPKATFSAIGYMVDLNTNAYDWYEPINISKSADGAWDEAPKFPGLTNAYFQALELGKDEFIKPFKG